MALPASPNFALIYLFICLFVLPVIFLDQKYLPKKKKKAFSSQF